jgi:hypothetical protein
MGKAISRAAPWDGTIVTDGSSFVFHFKKVVGH